MIRFRVYGVGPQEELTARIAQWMAESHIPYRVETVGDVDQFIQEGIHSIPTVVIQSEVKIEQRQFPDQESFAKALRKISTKMHSITSKKIVVPVDFSPTSRNAADYAINLSAALNGGIELVHVLNPATDLNTGYMIDPGIEEVKRKKLQQWADELAAEHQISVTSRFILGFPIEELTRLSEEKDTLMVLGATGESDLLERVFGSVPAHLARRAHSPVLVVPRDARYKPFREIVYASNDSGLDYRVANIVKSFVSQFECRLHSVHIGKSDDYPEWQMRAIFGTDDTAPELVTAHLQERNIIEKLNEYCEDNEADLLILTTRQRNFWNSLVHTSVTRELALNPGLPLLVFQEASN